MSEERYLTMSFADWSDAVDMKRLKYSGDLLDLGTASKVASGNATDSHQTYYLLKVVPVQLHRATVTLDVTPL